MLASSMLLGLAACSSTDDDLMSSNIANNQVIGAGMDDVTSDYLSTVTNTLSATRAAGAGYETLLPEGFPTAMPAEPTVPSNAVEYDASNQGSKQGVTGTNWNDWSFAVVSGNTTVTNINLSYQKLYVKGNLTIDGSCWGGGEIYVLSGGSLTIKMNEAGCCMLKNNSTKVYNWGTLNIGSDQLYIGSSEALYNAGTITGHSGKDFKVQGTFYTTGNMVNWKSYTFENGCKVNILGDLRCITPGTKGSDADRFDLGTEDKVVEGYIHVSGKIIAKNITIGGAGLLVNDCEINASEKFTTNSTNSVYANYIHAGSMYQCSTAKIYVADKGFINVDGTYRNDNNGNDGAIVLTDGGTAVVHANKFEFNGSQDPTKAMTAYFLKTPVEHGKIWVNCNTWQFNAVADAADEPSHPYMPADSVIFAGNVEYISQVAKSTPNAKEVIPSDSCHGAGFYTTPDSSSVHVDVVSDQHTHDISATCIQSDGENVYLSFHQRGNKQSGCIEWITTNGDQTTLRQFVRDHNEAIDFNHIMLANNRIYAVGNTRDGGFLGYMNLKAGKMDVESSAMGTLDSTDIAYKTYAPLQMVRLHQAKTHDAKNGTTSGGDGNAVVYHNGQLKVASTYGLEVFDADLDSISIRPTAGKGKHIAIGEDGNVYFSYFTQQNTDPEASLPLQIEKLDDSNAAATSFAAGTVAPNNGKNVICEYDGKIYSAQGIEGLKVYNLDGTLAGEYVLNRTSASGKELKICANGVAVDANYVYVAYGSRGLRVLDRSTLKEVAKYVAGASANYVTLANGYIYVAYGKSNIKVFKLGTQTTAL